MNVLVVQLSVYLFIRCFICEFALEKSNVDSSRLRLLSSPPKYAELEDEAWDPGAAGIGYDSYLGSPCRWAEQGVSQSSDSNSTIFPQLI